MTIKEVADMAGVSKTAIRKRLADLSLIDRLEKNERGIVQIPPDVADTILQTFGNQGTENRQSDSRKRLETSETKAENTHENQKPGTTNQAVETAMSALIDQLRFQSEQLMEKDRQIAALQQTISKISGNIDVLTDALERAQALHAGTIQQQLSGGLSGTSDGHTDPVNSCGQKEKPDSAGAPDDQQQELSEDSTEAQSPQEDPPEAQIETEASHDTQKKPEEQSNEQHQRSGIQRLLQFIKFGSHSK